MTHPWFQASTRPRVLAHRGFVEPGVAGYVENSLAAFAAAEALGATYVESDCHLTRDGHVVLAHDLDLQRVAGDPRRIADLDLRELDTVMAGRGGLAVLPDVLETFPTLRWNLDVKVPAAAVPTGEAISRHAGRVLVAGFSDAVRRAAVAAARAAGGRTATSAGIHTVARAVIAARLGARRRVAHLLRDVDALQIPIRHGRWRVLSRALLDAAHAAGVEVHVWTVDDPGTMRRLFAAGVDGIVTDRADLALDVVRARPGAHVAR